MTRRTLVVLAFAVAGALAACVDVPDSMKAQFAAPAPTEKSNYRPGNHGTAPPADSPPAIPSPDAGRLDHVEMPDAGVVDASAEGGSV